jgi:hypothetical protein
LRIRAQWQAKQEGALEWRIRRANLPERWTLETFPFARQTLAMQNRAMREYAGIGTSPMMTWWISFASWRGSSQTRGSLRS